MVRLVAAEESEFVTASTCVCSASAAAGRTLKKGRWTRTSLAFISARVLSHRFVPEVSEESKVVSVSSNVSQEVEPLRLLAVHAHPDDEASKGSAMMASYVASGVEVMVATCTGGERGDIQNPALVGDPHSARDMGGARRVEMANAAKILGIQHQWLGFTDSGLPEGDPLPELPANCFALKPLEIAAAPLVRLVRRFRPHVIVAYDENGGYPHPDHIMAHKVAVEAFNAAGDPQKYPGTGPVWEPAKLYYDLAFNPSASVPCTSPWKKPAWPPRTPSVLQPGSKPTPRGTPHLSASTPPPHKLTAATTLKPATMPCAPTPPKWIRMVSSSPSAHPCSAKCGRGRTIRSLTHAFPPHSQRTTCLLAYDR